MMMLLGQPQPKQSTLSTATIKDSGTTKESSPNPLLLQTRKTYCCLNQRQWSRVGLAVLYFLVGGIFYYYFEGWGPNTSISFAIATMSSVGYGYHHPTNDNSRLFTMFYIVFGIYFVFVRLQAYLSKQMEYIASYVNSATDAAHLFVDYNRHKRMMILTMIAMLLCVIIGGAILTCLEDWTFIQGIYFALETSSTVGYGDLKITNAKTHLFLGFYIIFSTVLLSFAFSNYQMVKAQQKQLEKIENMSIRGKDLRFLVELDHDGKGVSEERFILAILQHIGKIDYEEDVMPWLQKLRRVRMEKDEEETRGSEDTMIYRDTLHDFYMKESLVVPNPNASEPDPPMISKFGPSLTRNSSSPFSNISRHSLAFAFQNNRNSEDSSSYGGTPYHYFPENGISSKRDSFRSNNNNGDTEMVVRSSTIDNENSFESTNPMMTL